MSSSRSQERSSGDASGAARAAAAAEVEGILDRRVGLQGTPTDDDLKPVFFFLVPSSPPPPPRSEGTERRHWYCSRAGGLERRAATYLIVLFAFKQQGTSKVWIDTLEGVLQGCAECARAFPVARRTWERLYFSKYPAQTRANFFKAVDRWQASLVGARLDAGDALLDLPPPLLQLAFNEPGVLTSEVVSGALDAAIATSPTARTPVADLALTPGLAHLLSSPSAPRRTWARAQLAAIRKPVAYDELRDSGLGDQLAALLAPSFPGTQAELWSTLSSLLSTDRLGVDAVQRALLAGQYSPDTPRPDRSVMAAIARHIGTPGDTFLAVFECFTTALRLSPTHHIWAFDTTPEFPRTLFAEIKENPSFESLVAGAQPSSAKGKGKEGAMDASPFAFIPNFLLSVLDVASTTEASSGFPGALAKAMSYLFGELQHDRLLEPARAAAAEAGCKTLTTLQERITSKDPGMAALTSVFEVHPGFIARVAFQVNAEAVWTSPRAAARDLVAQVFKADGREIVESVLGLAVIASAERRRLKRKRRAKPGQVIPEPVVAEKLHRAVIRRDLWRAAYDAFNPTDAEGLALLMTAVAPFAHVEKLNLAEAWDPRDLKEVVKAEEWITSVRTINSALTAIQTDFARVLESLAAQADPLVLGSLWKLPGVAKQAIILLLSPAEAIHEPVINLVQQSFDVDDRGECFRTLLASYAADAMDGLTTFLSSFVHSARIVPDSTSLAKWLVRCFTDVMDALCEAEGSFPPLLQTEAFLGIYANGRWMTRRVSDLWQLMTDALALIFRRTADWAPYYENDVMVDWMRDALIFGRMITDNIRVFESAILSRTAPKNADPSESPARMTHVAKGLVGKLEVVLADLVGWLRLTDAETLHQAFELIKTILGRIIKTKPDLAHNTKLEETLVELDKFCRRVSSAYNCRLSDDLLSELSDMLSAFDLPDDEVQFVKEVKARAPSPEVVSDSDSVTSRLRAASIKEPIKDKSKDSKTPPSTQERNAFAMMMKKAGGTYSPSESTRPRTPKPTKPRQMTLDEFEAQGDDFLNKLSANDLDIIEKRAQNTSKLTRPNAVQPSKPPGSKLMLNVVPRLYPEKKKPLSAAKYSSKLFRDVAREHKAARSGLAPPAPPRLPNASAIGTGIGAYTGSSKPKPKPKPESESSASESSSDEENKGLSALLARQKAPLAAKPAAPAQRFTINERRSVKVIGSDATDIIRQREEERRRQHYMKMRLRPDMTPLFRFVLGWNPACTDTTPPYTAQARTRLGPLQPVPTTFVNATQYEKVMLPLFLHELWAQFLKDDQASPSIIIEVVAKDYEDDFLDYTGNVRGNLPPNFSVNDADIVTIRHQGCATSRPVFAKVQLFRRKYRDAGIKLRVLHEVDPGTMGVGGKLVVQKHATLSTAMREFGALRGLPYYDSAILSDTLKAHSAAMPELTAAEVDNAMRQYQVNEPQARAILGAMRVRGFSLIQGPPGTGKTKTISGLVGKFMSDRTVPIATQGRTPDKPKILVCAPSNAAIDEVCKRLMEGVPSANGKRLHPNIVRIGIESSVNVAVKDVCLDNIVEARVNTESQRRDGGGTELARIQTALADVKRQIKDKQDEAAAVKNNEQRSKAIAEELQALNVKRTKLGQDSSKAKDAARDTTRHLDGERRKARDNALRDADVICATLSGSGQDVLSPFKFDTVIIDEAAQAIEMSCLIPLKYGCARCVMVGDPNQLPPTTFSAEADRFKFNQSLFVRIAQNKTSPMHLLSIQYRMHPDISTLPSKLFYQERLKDGEGMAEKTLARWHQTPIFGPYHFVNVNGEETKAGTSTRNPEEARVAVDLYRNLERQYGDVVSFCMRIGVITMYKEQLYELRRQFVNAFGQDIVDAIDFNTVDGFQGQEKDIIILSCVRSGPNLSTIGFLRDFRRMNVALTRAKSSLFVIGSAATLSRSDPRWRTIVDDARERGKLVDYTRDLFSSAPKAATADGGGGGARKQARQKRAASPDPSRGAIPKVQAVRDPRDCAGEKKRKAEDVGAAQAHAKRQRSSSAADSGVSNSNGAKSRPASRAAVASSPSSTSSSASPSPPPPPPSNAPPPPPPTTAPPPPPPPSAPAPVPTHPSLPPRPPPSAPMRPAPAPKPRAAADVLFMKKSNKPAARQPPPGGRTTNVRAAINNHLAGGSTAPSQARGVRPPQSRPPQSRPPQRR